MDSNIPWNIIIARFKDEISLADQEVLNQWLTSEKNQTIYIELRALWLSLLQEGIEYKSDVDALWVRMEARMNKNKPKEVRFTLNRFRWMSGVASVLLLMLFSFTGFITNQWYNTNTIAQTYSSLNGKSKVTLPDGSDVWLNAESTIEYSASAWGRTRNVNLTGEAYFDIKKDPDRPFIVKSHGVAVKVYGTTFNVEARDSKNDINVSLLSGSVSVETGNVSEQIIPGETAVCTRNTGEIIIEKSDVEFAAMWAKESVRFERKSIKELTKYLSKWYGVKIILDPSIPEDQAYTFSIQSEPLEEILRLMARINPVQYSFDEKNVVSIKKK